MTVLSLSELGFAVRWAACGAGVPIGLAEELAEAAKAIGLAGLDPARVVSAALGGLAAPRRWGDLTIDRTGEIPVLRAGLGGCLAAVEAGPVAADTLLLSQDDNSPEIQVKAVDHPLLASACLAAGGLANRTIRCQWGGDAGVVEVTVADGRIVETRVDSDTVLYAAGPSGLKIESRPITSTEADGVARIGIKGELNVPDQSWHELLRLASVSWVPSNAASRLTGAGAGLTDTD